jgi:regulator of protease activity HflC (stomatin/prohibitin superfamily)
MNLGIVLAVVAAIIVLLVIVIISKSVRIVQQGFEGVITRFGEFKDIKNPGLTFIMPFIEVMKIIDVRETPRTGDRSRSSPGTTSRSSSTRPSFLRWLTYDSRSLPTPTTW